MYANYYQNISLNDEMVRVQGIKQALCPWVQVLMYMFPPRDGFICLGEEMLP